MPKYIWTKEKVIESAKSYSNKEKWRITEVDWDQNREACLKKVLSFLGG